MKSGKEIGCFFMFAMAANCGILNIQMNLRRRSTSLGDAFHELEIVSFKKI